MTDTKNHGPTIPISEEIHALKYRQSGETFKQAMTRIADTLKDTPEHYDTFRNILLDMRFLPAGRVQASIGSSRQITAMNCYVSQTIPDSMDGIMDVAKRAAETLRLGGGLGYDFSTLRPRGDLIKSLESHSSGPVSFMGIFDAICSTVASAGHRRGAQMGVLRVDHPDIEEFIRAKQNKDKLTNFNVSIAITDKFMEAVRTKGSFDLVFGGRVYKTIDAWNLWSEIMRGTWDWAEPGVLFIDTINRENNLSGYEVIAATNPCGEQPLPPNGACLLGSFNLVKYLEPPVFEGSPYLFNLEKFKSDIPPVVRAMDNVIDKTVYPLVEQELEAKSKRRMGIGITGTANAIEAMGHPYGSDGFCEVLSMILKALQDTLYSESSWLGHEKGYCITGTRRNSHLTSIAPTGTISLTADNISSGIEPVFSYGFTRTIQTPEGARHEYVEDYGSRVLKIKGKTADQCTVDEHLKVLLVASQFVDSAVSKTINVGDNVTFEDFKDIYMKAWEGGAKGCTTFRLSGKRAGIFVSEENQGTACFIDPSTGQKTCE